MPGLSLAQAAPVRVSRDGRGRGRDSAWTACPRPRAQGSLSRSFHMPSFHRFIPGLVAPPQSRGRSWEETANRRGRGDSGHVHTWAVSGLTRAQVILKHLSIRAEPTTPNPWTPGRHPVSRVLQQKHSQERKSYSREGQRRGSGSGPPGGLQRQTLLQRPSEKGPRGLEVGRAYVQGAVQSPAGQTLLQEECPAAPTLSCRRRQGRCHLLPPLLPVSHHSE